MTIVDFYKELSKILTDCREGFILRDFAEKKLTDLLEQASKSKLDVNVSESIFDPINLMRLDDEKSFNSDDEEFGYDGDNSIFSY